MRVTEEEFQRIQSRMRGLNSMGVNEKPVKPRKFRNEPVEWEGQKFDSQLELGHWKDFQLMKANGSIRSVARQVSFCLPGTKRRIRIDHMVTELDGRQTFYDSKGFETPEWQLKRDLVRDGLGITIHLLKRR